MKLENVDEVDPFNEEDWDEFDFPYKVVFVRYYQGRNIICFKNDNKWVSWTRYGSDNSYSINIDGSGLVVCDINIEETKKLNRSNQKGVFNNKIFLDMCDVQGYLLKKEFEKIFNCVIKFNLDDYI